MTDFKKEIDALVGPILVIGASGFIGANLFKMISKHRIDVYAVVRHDKGWRLEDVADEHILEANLNDRNATKNLLNSIKPKTVFDCKAYGAYSFEEESYLIYQTNFLSVVGLIEQLGSDVSAYVHAGSSSEYGSNCAAPLEDSTREPNSHYALSKSSTADYIAYAGKRRSFPCVNLRLYSVYGALEDTSRLIPNVLSKGLEGTYPPFVNPDISRDFVYVDDVCRAFVLAATRMNVDLYGESINIGSGQKTTIKGLAFVCKDVFDIPSDPAFNEMKDRSWDLTDWYSNPSKAFDLIGWKAETPLAVGLERTAEWIKGLSKEETALATKRNPINKRRSISAIIACYKDGQAIPYMHKRLTETFKKIDVDYEIIFVNDCSPDDSAKVIAEISESDPHVLGITHSRNFGSQMAFRSGMELSTKDAVVLLDGDLQDPPELIEELYNEWCAGNDVVYGRRVKREMSMFWGFMYKAFYRIFAAFSYIEIPHDAGDFSLIDRRVVRWMLQFPERDLFMRGVRAYVGFKQKGVDYVRPERMFGVSTNSLFKNISWAKKGIFSYSDTPLTILTAVGVSLLLISIASVITIAALRIFNPDIAPRGATTVLISILFFGSINLFAISMLGEYIAKIMAEVKGRPRLIRASLTRNGSTTNYLPTNSD